MPSIPKASPAASAAGTTAHPGCDCENECESSVSSAWAITPLAIAASAGPAVSMEPAIVATPVPPCALAYRIAAWPGGNSESGNHRRERIGDVVPRVFDDFSWELSGCGAAHVRCSVH